MCFRLFHCRRTDGLQLSPKHLPNGAQMRCVWVENGVRLGPKRKTAGTKTGNKSADNTEKLRNFVQTNKKHMKIFCIASNYASHNKERADALYITERPVVFLKADSSLLKPGKPFFVPDHMGRIDFEAEVVIRICRLGKNIPQRFAYRYYDALTLGIDFTARELQQRLKQEGQPWELSKAFDSSAAIGCWVEKEYFKNISHLPFRLEVNGETRQKAHTSDMLRSIDELIAYISQFFTLKTGDMLFTGTPAGSGEIHIGDLLEGYLDDKKVMQLRCK